MRVQSATRPISAVFFSLVGITRAEPAWAMHISEGILPPGWAILWWLIIIPFLYLGLRKLAARSRNDLSYKPLAGFIVALVFVVSLMPIPVPIAGTTAHPAGTAISGVILGPLVSVVTATAALLLQALFLAHGGLSTLGANVFAMGVMGSFTGWLTFLALRRLGAGLGQAGFGAGVMADWATYATTALVLSLGISGDSPFFPLFTKVILAFLPTQLPLGLLAGAITGGIFVLLAKRRPEILRKLGITGIILTLGLLLYEPALAQGKWPGLDEAVIERIAEEAGRKATGPLIDTDQGNLLLFLFLIAGAVGGFIAGYCWRSTKDSQVATKND